MNTESKTAYDLVEDFVAAWRKERNTEDAVYAAYHYDAMVAFAEMYQDYKSKEQNQNMEQNTFMDRLIEEREQIQGRLNKLVPFIMSEAFNKIDQTQRSILKIQAAAMETYFTCLHERIKLIESEQFNTSSEGDWPIH